MIRRILPILLLLTACSGNGNRSGDTNAAPETWHTDTRETVQTSATDRVQVLYFHGRKRCATCNAIERLTRETVERLGEKKVGIRILEIGQNEELAEQYGVTWSSLLLVRNDTVKNLTRTAFELAKSRPETFKARLPEAIEHFAE